MLRGTAACSRCRHVYFSGPLDQWMTAIGPTTFKRFRTKGSGIYPRWQPKFDEQSSRTQRSSFDGREASGRFGISSAHQSNNRFRWSNPRTQPETGPKVERIAKDNIIPFFEEKVKSWSKSKQLAPRLESFGIPAGDVSPLVKAFVKAVGSGELSTPEAFDLYALSRFGQDFTEDSVSSSIDAIYSTVLLAWASNPKNVKALTEVISPSTLAHVEALTRAADYSHPEEEFHLARSMRRKVIMHVGPTNSGKTHNALRALAASPTGVYAGPLRLLAHEIWERLNLGQIVPLGAEEGPVLAKPSKPDSNTALDVPPNAKAVQRFGNPAHARLCNMLTGEEHKIVDSSAGLLSCTVEMLPYSRPLDVAVIDEIQMIGDPDRGSGWTRAVLGIPAKEVHLCGEETAVPLVEEILKATGDELIVNRYQRLTPLTVATQSLDGDLREVKKGDCIVTFRRESIFALKQKIESQTPMRCAVVYGRLPPETRSEQAALFNDPNSGYDVLLGSDAIGMGLNLKIRRVIFEAVSKFDGTNERFLSISQTKQIAGRAGRFGLHGKDSNGGQATTLLKKDLSFLQQTMEKTVPTLEIARVIPMAALATSLATVLPAHSGTDTVFSAPRYISIPPPMYRFSSMTSNQKWFCKFIDTNGAGLTLSQRLSYLQAPLPKSSDPAMTIVAKLIQMHDESMDVSFTDAIEGSDFIEELERVEYSMKNKSMLRYASDTLRSLESLHKAIVTYVWLSFRHPLVFNQHTETVELKRRVEMALDWTLQEMTKDLPLQDVRKIRSTKPRINYSSRHELQAATTPQTYKKSEQVRKAIAGVAN